MRPKFLLLFILLLPAVVSSAAIFTVVSNAERGAGTLAEALQNAAANGTAQPDRIVFNISGSTQSDRTILITQALPDVTGNLEIDGTTQPGTAFGITDTKVCLQWSQNLTTATDFLYFKHADNVSIFGLMFNQPLWEPLLFYPITAIHYFGCNNVTIGLPGKGNYFAGFTYCVSTMLPYTSPQQSDYEMSTSFTAQGNIIGLNPLGYHSGNYNEFMYFDVDYAFYLTNVANVLIGGAGKGEGNYIFARKTLNSMSTIETGNGYIKLFNNKIGVDITGTINNNGSSSTLFTEIKIIGGSLYSHTSDASVEIKHNTIVGSVRLENLVPYFFIQSNTIYSTNWSGENSLVSIGDCTGIVGGETDAEGNDLYAQSYRTDLPSDQAAISSGHYTEIKHNSIHCNKYEGSSVNPASEENNSYYITQNPWIATNVLKPGYVEGKTCNGCRVDVYEDDECHACEGKVFLGSTMADKDGNWSFTGNFTGSVVAMATDATATTSGFSAPWVLIDGVELTQPDCDKPNGAIKGVKLQGADRFEWKKIVMVPYVGEQATVITNEHLDLDNIPPGTYEITPGFGPTCNGISRRFTLKDETYVINDAAKTLTQPSCGQNDGAITGITISAADFYNTSGYKTLIWKEITTNTVVGTTADVDKLFAGTYKLYVTNKGGCVDSAGPYVLTNRSGPTLNTASVVISNETCSAGNGSITGISVSNAAGTSSVQWEDDKGNIAGNTLDLKNIPAGIYKLKYKDGSACGTIATNFFTVTNDGIIAIDESRKQVKNSSCTVSDGTITGMAVSGASIYQWMNTAGNTAVAAGNQPDLLNVAAGTYQLSVSNQFGCKETSSVIEVKQSGFAPPALSSLSYLDASCGEASGNIHPQFSQPVSGYSFQWVDSISQVTISNDVNADHLNASQYYLVATDPNHCKEKILSAAIVQLGKPSIDDSHVLITGDLCHTNTGSIDNLQVSGGRKDYTWNWFTTLGENINTHTSKATLLPEGMYYTTVADKDGCSTKSEVFTVKNKSVDVPVPVLSVSNVSVSNPAVIKIENPGSGMYQLYRSPADAAPVATSPGNTITTPAITEDSYWYVRNVNGDCMSDFAKAQVSIIRKTRLAIPSAFSPNNDGVNDLWFIGWQGSVTHYQLSVYDRFGKAVYTSHDIYKGWDGKLNGITLNTGSYVYLIKLTDNDGKQQQLSGMVTLVY